MSAFYCLANTQVMGEMLLQQNTVTYTASATAISSGNTFAEASRSATEKSNIAATEAARIVVDGILAQYSYILFDENITSTNNTQLQTTVRLIIPIGLATIASSSDGTNYVLNQNVNVADNGYVFIGNGQTLSVPDYYSLTGSGTIQVGTGKNISSMTLNVTAPYTNTLTTNVAPGASYQINGPTSGESVLFSNSTTITNAGQTVLKNTSLLNTTTGSVLNLLGGSVSIKPN